MKEKFITRYFLVLLLISICESLAFGNNGVLEFSNQNIDLGNVYYEDIYQINIPFKNIGTDKIHLLKVNTDCGCSQATFSHEWLNPGDAAVLSVNFKPIEGETPFYRSIILLTDAKISQYSISLQGNVTNLKNLVSIPLEYNVRWMEKKKAIPVLSNYSIQLQGNQGDEVVFPLYITNIGAKPLVLESLNTKGKAEALEFPRNVEQGEVVLIPLKIKFAEEGASRDYFKLITDEKSILIRMQTIVN